MAKVGICRDGECRCWQVDRWRWSRCRSTVPKGKGSETESGFSELHVFWRSCNDESRVDILWVELFGFGTETRRLGLDFTIPDYFHQNNIFFLTNSLSSFFTNCLLREKKRKKCSMKKIGEEAVNIQQRFTGHVFTSRRSL